MRGIREMVAYVKGREWDAGNLANPVIEVPNRETRVVNGGAKRRLA